MNGEDKSRDLEGLAHLWTSGEWTLHVTHHSRQRVILVFQAGRPTTSELIAVRALLPQFTNAPVTELKREVGGLAELPVGEFSNLEARSFLSAAKARGLQVRTEDASYVSRLPVKDGACLLIEDDELFRRVGEEMERRGVPIVHAESD